MDLNKILIIILFLGILICAQIFLRYFRISAQTEDLGRTQVRHVCRLAISTTERVDIVDVENQSFLIVFSKGSRPVIRELSCLRSDTVAEHKL